METNGKSAMCAATKEELSDEELRRIMERIEELLAERPRKKRRKIRGKDRYKRVQSKGTRFEPESVGLKAQKKKVQQVQAQSVELQDDGTWVSELQIDIDALLELFGLTHVDAEDLTEEEVEELVQDYHELMAQLDELERRKRRRKKLPEPRPRPPVFEPPVEPPIRPPVEPRPPEGPVFRPHMHYDGPYKGGGDDDEDN